MQLEPSFPSSRDRFDLAIRRLGRRLRGTVHADGLDDAVQKAGNRMRGSDQPFGLALDDLKRSGIPLPMIDLAPGTIEYLLCDWVKVDGRAWHSLDGFLGSGDWSAILRPPWQITILKEARQLHKAGLRYQQIPAYGRLCKLAETGKPVTRQQVRLSDRPRIDAYFERYAALFRSIEKEGLWKVPSPGDRLPGVALTAGGQFVRLQGGQHRWAIAMTLELPTVPVELRLLHLDAWRSAGSVDECVARALDRLSSKHP
jgi:hypothetical protein